MARADLPSSRALREQVAVQYASDEALSYYLTRVFRRLYSHNPTITWLSVACPLTGDYGEGVVLVNETRLDATLGQIEMDVPLPLSCLRDGEFPLAYWLTSRCDEVIEQALEFEQG